MIYKIYFSTFQSTSSKSDQSWIFHECTSFKHNLFYFIAKQSLFYIVICSSYMSYNKQFHHCRREMTMFNLFDVLAMTRIKARVGLLKGQLNFIISI